MNLLNDQVVSRAEEIFQQYLSAEPQNDNAITPAEEDEQLDKNRLKSIEEQLLPLVISFIEDKENLSDFKTQIDSINKRGNHWGFKGIKGQMFFNLLFNSVENLDECAQEMKAAIHLPENEQIASSRMRTFISFVTRVREEWKEAGKRLSQAPVISSIPFFLSYFWMIQNWQNWPVYYTNSVNTLEDLHFWGPAGDLVSDYISFKNVMEELRGRLSSSIGRKISLLDVEHMFWWFGEKPVITTAKGRGQERREVEGETARDFGLDISTEFTKTMEMIPDSFVPPVVSILPRLASPDVRIKEAAESTGVSIERAFEKNVHATFTILGYECKLLGQGSGRNPDGEAIAHDESYAIIWDAKVREKGYSIGTDDRTIREYITIRSREIKKRCHLRNIYYIIISSSFTDDFEDTIHSIKMETDVSEVCLMEAKALVVMVDQKLRDPIGITLGQDGLQRLYLTSGILTAEIVRRQMM